MSNVIALHWNETELHYVFAREDRAVAQEDGQIEAAASVALKPGRDTAAIGQQLAEALASYSPGRAKVIVALGRGALQWQHLSLPPCPADELPEVVRLQADRDLSPTDDDLGFDFLPLVGDHQTPHEVLAITLAASKLAEIREVCLAAHLTLERIVPLAAGWPAITQQAAPDVKQGTHIFVARQASEATLWATRAGHIVLFRQFQLAASEDPTALAAVVGNELRRTLLTLSQHAENGNPTITLVGHHQTPLEELAQSLQKQLDVSVQSQKVTTQHPALTLEGPTIPLTGFAVDESQGTPPLVDLLHPRQPPQTQFNLRTYAPTAALATLLVALVGWLSYDKLQTPLNKAAKDQAELTLLEQSLDDLEVQEQHAAAIRDWNAAAPNMLLHLQQVSKSIRPKAFADEDFAVEQDVVLEKLNLDKRQLTLEAMARNSRAVQPLEARLRTSAYRPQRIKSDPSETIPEYPWYFKSTIDITTASDSTDHSSMSQSAGKTPNIKTIEEPSS